MLAKLPIITENCQFFKTNFFLISFLIYIFYNIFHFISLFFLLTWFLFFKFIFKTYIYFQSSYFIYHSGDVTLLPYYQQIGELLRHSVSPSVSFMRLLRTFIKKWKSGIIYFNKYSEMLFHELLGLLPREKKSNALLMSENKKKKKKSKTLDVKFYEEKNSFIQPQRVDVINGVFKSIFQTQFIELIISLNTLIQR